MAGAAIAPALPEMSSVFQDQTNSDFFVRLALTIPALFIALGAPVAGYIIDRWGRRQIFIASVILFGFAGTSGIFLDSLLGIIIGRAILGIAVAGIMTTATTLIADYYEGLERNKVVGLQAAYMAFGGVVFLLVGGFLADLGWRSPFLIYLSAFGLAPLVFYFIKEPKTVLVGTKKTSEIQRSTLIAIYVLAFVSMVVFYILPVQLPFYLTGLGLGPSEVGLALASTTFFAGLTSVFYKRIKSRLGFGSIFIINFLLMGFGYLTIYLAQTYSLIVGGLIVSGFGLGLLLPNLTLWLISKATESSRGKIVGGLTMSIFLGQFSAPIITQPIIGVFGLGSSILFGSVVSILIIVPIAVLQAKSFTRKRK